MMFDKVRSIRGALYSIIFFMSKLTPMMQQYMDTKSQYQDAILFFRLGDFYEMFFEDAVEASRVLDIALTKKNCGIDGERAPMCGVPFHSADAYIAKLIENGYKVAICEQTEDPKLTKTLVKRDVVRVVTPGTITGDTMLVSGENNYLAAVYMGQSAVGLTYADISTGELAAAVIGGGDRMGKLVNELIRIGVKEILLCGAEGGQVTALTEQDDTNPDAPHEILTQLRVETGAFVTNSGYSAADIDRGRRSVVRVLEGRSLKGLGVEENSAAAGALYALFAYLEDTQKQPLAYMSELRVYELSDRMMLDKASIRNLELTETLFERQTKGSLLGVLDRTHTAMGGRMLKKWLKEPLIGTDAIRLRLDAVDSLLDDVLKRNDIKAHLKVVYDLERLAGRVSYGNANARDLIALCGSAAVVPEIKNALSDASEKSLLAELCAAMSDLSEVRGLIETAITDDPPFTVREGGLIRAGYAPELDALKDSIRDGQHWIASLEGKERERTGIKNLKVGYNRVFGYYIDVTNANKTLIPADYIRKQTLVNSERYITPELKEVESVVLGAETKINEMEYDLFNGIRQMLQAHIRELQATAQALAVLDVLTSFAETAEKLNYTRPEVGDGSIVEILKGRHPVIEDNLTTGAYVPGDVYINRQERGMLLITGPNMAGKSTYMRMTALIVLMAQVGSFVPADKAVIGVVDRLYTRIGASDNLAKGESTFFVEMSELAYILNTCTENSLIILDEIGRGTSTYDGLSIAWAVLEHLCGRQIRTLFATHYHELTVLEGKLPGLINLNTEISEKDGSIVFLHRITEGSASRSYGIHVARLAGVPESLLENAQVKLNTLESERQGIEMDWERHAAPVPERQNAVQMSLFDIVPDSVLQRLKGLNLMEITPSQAFSILEELKSAADRTGYTDESE